MYDKKTAIQLVEDYAAMLRKFVPRYRTQPLTKVGGWNPIPVMTDLAMIGQPFQLISYGVYTGEELQWEDFKVAWTTFCESSREAQPRLTYTMSTLLPSVPFLAKPKYAETVGQMLTALLVAHMQFGKLCLNNEKALLTLPDLSVIGFQGRALEFGDGTYRLMRQWATTNYMVASRSYLPGKLKPSRVFTQLRAMLESCFPHLAREIQFVMCAAVQLEAEDVFLKHFEDLQPFDQVESAPTPDQIKAFRAQQIVAGL